MFPPFLFIFLKEHKLNLLHRWQRCNNVSSWTSDIFFLNSCGHQATETKEFSHMHTFLGSFKKSGPASQIVCSRVTFPPLAEWKHWARTRLRVYCRKKMGQKYRRTHMNDPFWPTAPKLWVRDANFGLPWKGQKLALLGWQLCGNQIIERWKGSLIIWLPLCCRSNSLPRAVKLKYDKVPASWNCCRVVILERGLWSL